MTSGDGDVDTSTVVEVAENDTTLKGATGRTLTLPDGVKCPTRKFRTGLKRIFELFPKPLLRRVQEERKQSFMEEQQRAVSAAQRALADFNAAHASPNDAEKRQKKDLEHALEALKEAADAYTDPGPVFDCLVYHDGERWIGAVDTTATGDFRRAKFMTNFRAGREWGTISGVAGTREHSVLLNYCLNVYEDGARLSIVTDCGSHGTHVSARPRTPRVAFAPRPPLSPTGCLLPSGEERCAPLRPRADAARSPRSRSLASWPRVSRTTRR